MDVDFRVALHYKDEILLLSFNVSQSRGRVELGRISLSFILIPIRFPLPIVYVSIYGHGSHLHIAVCFIVQKMRLTFLFPMMYGSNPYDLWCQSYVLFTDGISLAYCCSLFSPLSFPLFLPHTSTYHSLTSIKLNQR